MCVQDAASYKYGRQAVLSVRLSVCRHKEQAPSSRAIYPQTIATDLITHFIGSRLFVMEQRCSVFSTHPFYRSTGSIHFPLYLIARSFRLLHPLLWFQYQVFLLNSFLTPCVLSFLVTVFDVNFFLFRFLVPCQWYIPLPSRTLRHST